MTQLIRFTRFFYLSIFLIITGCVAISEYEWTHIFSKQISTKVSVMAGGNVLITTSDNFGTRRIQELNSHGDVINDRKSRIVGSSLHSFINSDQYLASIYASPSAALVDIEEGIVWETPILQAPYYHVHSTFKQTSDSLITISGQYSDTEEDRHLNDLGGYVSVIDLNGNSLWQNLYPGKVVLGVHKRDDVLLVALKQDNDTIIVKQYDWDFEYIGDLVINKKGWLNIYEQGFIVKSSPTIAYILDSNGNELFTTGYNVRVSPDEAIYVLDESKLTRYEWDGRVVWETNISIPDDTQFGVNFNVSGQGIPTISYTTTSTGTISLAGATIRYQTHVLAYDKENGNKTEIHEQPAESIGMCFVERLCEDKINKQGHLKNLGTWTFGDNIYTLNEYGYPAIFIVNEQQTLSQYKLQQASR